METKDYIQRLESINGRIGKGKKNWFKVWYAGMGHYSFDILQGDIVEQLDSLANNKEIVFTGKYIYLPVYTDTEVKTLMLEEWRLK